MAGLRSRQPWLRLGEGMRSPRHLAAFLLAIGGMVFYILLSERLGFVLCSVLVLFALQWACGVRPRVAVPVALSRHS